MKKITFALIFILVFLFAPIGWCAGYGQGAKAFTDAFEKTSREIDEDRRANEALKMEKQRLELQRKAMEQEQERLELQRKTQEQQKNDIPQNNGTAWNKFDETMKIFYLYGFTMAAHHIPVGADGGTTDFNDKENKQIKLLADRIFSDQGKKEKNKNMMFTKDEIQFWGKAMINLEGDRRNNVLGRYMIPKITIRQIQNGLDVLYKDFKNESISIPSAIYVVKKQINGSSLEEIEATLQYLRSDGDSSKLSYIDKDGKNKKASFP